MTESRSTLPTVGNDGCLASEGSVLSTHRCTYRFCPLVGNTSKVDVSTHLGSITLDSLAEAFLEHAKETDRSNLYTFRSAVRVLLKLYAGTPVDSFTPKCLVAVQQQFTQEIGKNGKPHSRQYCNALVAHIRWMFRWGVAQELVSPSTAVALGYVPDLRYGQTAAPETEPREKSVSDEVVNATLPYLLPTVSAMVQVQRLTAMQPHEICRMRVGDIDRTRKDGVWVYSPPKKSPRQPGKVIPLGPREQALILPYLAEKSPNQAVFSPKTAMLEKKEKDALRRKTKVFPSQVQRAAERAEKPTRKLQEHYTSLSYAQSIKRAIELANRSLLTDQKILHWSPYQLCEERSQETGVRSQEKRERTESVGGNDKKLQPLPSALPIIGNDGGTAFVQIDGKRINLGKVGSPESYANYARCLNGLAVADAEPEPVQSSQPTVNSLVTAFLSHIQSGALSYYLSCSSATKVLLKLYPDTPVESFTPECLVAVQQQFIQEIDKHGKLYSRQYSNTLIECIKKMFQWGTAQELVSPKAAFALRGVPALERGHTQAREARYSKQSRVPDEVVNATLPYLLPTVSTMVQVQRLAGMQANEICRMRVGDIDRDRKNGIWIYSPPKRTRRDQGIAIPLDKLEQALILPYLEGKLPEQAVFSPKTAMQEKKVKDAERRKTEPDSWKKKRAAEHAANPKRTFGEHYASPSYVTAIKHAVQMANRSLPEGQKIPFWSPVQLCEARSKEAGVRSQETWGVSSPARERVGHSTGRLTPPHFCDNVTINSLTTAFLDQARNKGNRHSHSYNIAVKVLLQLHSGLPVDSFTPKCLVAVQQQFTQEISSEGKLYSRQYCNQLIQLTKQIFRWGVEQEFVSPATVFALKQVRNLQRDQTHVRDAEPREKSVSDEVVDATLPHLLPVVAAMVQVQRLAAMQPNEICRMRVGDIDMSRENGIWIYSPPKTPGREYGKTIPLGKLEQSLILPYLEGKSSDRAVFSPQTALLEKKERDEQRKKTKDTSSQMSQDECSDEIFVQRVHEHYSSATYYQSINWAIKNANRSLPDDQKIPLWFPSQLRYAEMAEATRRNDKKQDMATKKLQPMKAALSMSYSGVLMGGIIVSPRTTMSLGLSLVDPRWGAMPH